jgi:cytochrome c oxidase subunit 4
MTTRATFLVVWLSALVLLGINIGISRLDLGPFKTVPIMLIAATQALLILWFFLHVRRASALVRLARSRRSSGRRCCSGSACPIT